MLRYPLNKDYNFKNHFGANEIVTSIFSSVQLLTIHFNLFIECGK